MWYSSKWLSVSIGTSLLMECTFVFHKELASRHTFQHKITMVLMKQLLQQVDYLYVWLYWTIEDQREQTPRDKNSPPSWQLKVNQPHHLHAITLFIFTTSPSLHCTCQQCTVQNHKQSSESCCQKLHVIHPCKAPQSMNVDSGVKVNTQYSPSVSWCVNMR